MYVDCHSHLSFLDIVAVDDALKVGKDKNLTTWVLGGYNKEDWDQQSLLKKAYPESLCTAYGLHPWESIRLGNDSLSELGQLIKIVDEANFIGETGLDFFVKGGKESFEIQKKVFEYHLNLPVKKPYVFHIVQAHEKALDILKNSDPVDGFVHGYSGSYETAKRYIDQGIMLSFSSSILSENFVKARESLKKIPIDSLLIESDSPSSKEDSSDPVKTYFEVAQEVANLRGIEIDLLLEKVTQNFKSLIYKYD